MNPSTRRITVLNIDDDPVLRLARTRILTEAGFLVHEAGSGETALELVRTQRADLVLVDAGLSDISGRELCRRIRASSGMNGVPILQITSGPGPEVAEDIDSDFDACLPAPVEPHLLVATAGALLRINHAERAANEAARQWQATFDALNDGIALIDASGRVMRCNAALARVLRMSRHEISGSRLSDLLKASMEAEGELPCELVIDSLEREIQDLRARDGWHRLTADPVLNERGEAEGAVCILSDITERRLAEQERGRLLRDLHAERSRLETILRFIPAGLIIAEAPTGRILLGNEQAAGILRLYGQGAMNTWDPSELRGSHPDGRLYSPDELPLARAMKGERVQGEEMAIVRADGSRANMRVGAAPIHGETGEVIAAVIVLDEITDQKRIEESLRRSNEDLQQFAFVASHDLQEPLRIISMNAQFLARRYQGILDRDADEFISAILDSSDRMRVLIDDLLSYSRVASAQDDSFHPVSCEVVLQWVVMNLQVVMNETGTIITHDPLPTVTGDQTRLIQLFQNLLSNAIKYGKPDERPRIHVSARLTGEEWLLSVSDNGIGIENQYLERIFGLFKRLHGRECPGTGIGLALCARIVERHGGRIWAESEPGKGSTFYFTLPAT